MRADDSEVLEPLPIFPVPAPVISVRIINILFGYTDSLYSMEFLRIQIVSHSKHFKISAHSSKFKILPYVVY